MNPVPVKGGWARNVDEGACELPAAQVTGTSPGTSNHRELDGDTLSAEEIEVELLLEAMHRRYGYDFRNYSRPSIRRSLGRHLTKSGFSNLSELQHRLLHDPAAFRHLLLDLTITVTSMFRDPSFFSALRKEVIPQLRREPFIRIWHAGCSSGEEVYSLAILLAEEGIDDGVQIYATDLNEEVVHHARLGVYRLEDIRGSEERYRDAGGASSLLSHFDVSAHHATIGEQLKARVVFATHNLATDGTFNEMNLIVCRNVLIYFDRELQDRALGLFRGSLAPNGILALGSRENIRFTRHSSGFEELIGLERIYRRSVPGAERHPASELLRCSE